MLNHLTTLQEYAQIHRGEHPEWSGDDFSNGESFLLQVLGNTPGLAKEIAYDIECNLEAYSEEIGLPQVTLERAQRLLRGIWP